MKKIKIILLVTLLQIIIFNAFLLAEEKHKVLLLHIIEENWDDLELLPPKHFGIVEPITKKEALKGYKEYKENEENARINARKSFRGLKKEIIVGNEKASAIRWIKFLLKEGNVTTDTKLRIDYDIRYYGKTFLLKEEDTFMKDAFRLGNIKAGYVYNEFPLKISILTEGPKAFSKQRKKITPIFWDHFEEIRLVEDINILSYDEIGNLKIKYDNNEYNLNAESVLELPAKEADLTKDEMMKFRERYYDYYRQNYNEPWIGKPEGYFTGQLFQITSSNNTFHFGTKVTIINYGY